MPGPFIPDPTPAWLKPENASVTETALTKAMRMIGHLIGADNPTAQVLGLMMSDVPSSGEVGGLAKAVEGLKQRAIKAYHGSPHDFERFSLEKIGTGEGAQAYGHGLYFAENPTVAKDYQNKLAGWNSPARYSIKGVETSDDLTRYVASSVYEHGRPETVSFFKKTALEEAANGGRLTPDHEPGWFQRAADLAQTMNKRDITKEQGRMYEVAIHADPEDFLDWDKPLSQQPQAVKDYANQMYRERLATRKAGFGMVDVHEKGGGTLGTFPAEKVPEVLQNPADYYPYTGEQFYRDIEPTTLNPKWGRESAAKELKQAGIPGIKYLDQGSRDVKNIIVGVTRKSDGVLVAEKAFASQPEANNYAQEMASKGMLTNIRDQGSRNYVVFDDRLIDILKKYGLLLPAAGAATQGQTLIIPRGEQ